MVNDQAIITSGLTKMYKDSLAVNALDMSVEKGTIFGFLGLNGAGKTTTIKMLLNLVYPTSGNGTVLGLDIVKQSLQVREKVGYVPEEPVIYEYMKVSEVIDFCKNTYKNWDMKVVGQYLDLFGLSVGKRVKELSKGMKNQLALTIALGSRPEVLILDEPTQGLDPMKTRDFFRVVLDQVAETGQTVFFSSHNLYEVERVADAVGIIHNGKLVFTKDLNEIKTNLKRVRVVFKDEAKLDRISDIPGVVSVMAQGRGYLIECESQTEKVVETLKHMAPLDIEVINMGLEDIFVKYTGGGPNV